LIGEKMPIVEIKWFKGRDKSTKKRVMELITKAICENCDVDPDAVTVIFHDIEKSNWGKAGKPYQ
jgi:4-oxalocrotonate tautomerase